jgi:hypothetical protein
MNKYINNILSILLGLLIVQILWDSFNNDHIILSR